MNHNSTHARKNTHLPHGRCWKRGTTVSAWGAASPIKQGRIVVFFPYPEPINPPISSPPTPRTALTSQVWPIELRAFYAPLVPVPPSPDLCAALMQSPATLLSSLSPPTPLTQVNVAYGVDAIVKTVGRSDLLIS